MPPAETDAATPAPTVAAPDSAVDRATLDAAGRRRTFAIISHPDAGKTTLTEKLLLYGGAVQEAGAVRSKGRGREVTSDWMELERRRGISVTSTALHFTVGDVTFNLLDTPGHRDFSEDTLRVLAAADSAVMLLDGAKGVEPQTLRLFEVAKARNIPLLTLINKYDRPGLDPLHLLDHIEETLHLKPTPVTWPVGIPGAFRGVIDRRTGSFHRFERVAGGSKIVPTTILSAEEAAASEGDAWKVAQEEVELLDAIGANHDHEAFMAGRTTPVFFGSAVSNFGVGLLLEALMDLAPAPSPHIDVEGGHRPLQSPFSGFVFKIQANSDPRHRDRVAFLRICSGHFERGMKVINARTGKPFTMSYAHEVFAQERAALEEAWPGDVIGVVNALDLTIGDTLYAADPVVYPPIPSLAPELFAFARNADTGRSKQFRKGLQQLDEEGVVHLLTRVNGDPTPVLGGVGQLQFDVAQERMATEFGAAVRLEPTPYTTARRTDEGGEAALRHHSQAEVLVRTDGTRLAVFQSPFVLQFFQERNPDVLLDTMLTR
jgi:peptide chain release factor 3